MLDFEYETYGPNDLSLPGYDSDESEIVIQTPTCEEKKFSSLTADETQSLILQLRMWQSRKQTLKRLKRELESIDSLPLSENDRIWKKLECEFDINKYEQMKIKDQLAEITSKLNASGFQFEE